METPQHTPQDEQGSPGRPPASAFQCTCDVDPCGCGIHRYTEQRSPGRADEELTVSDYPPTDLSTPVILCPRCDHGIDPHGIDPGGPCGVGDEHRNLCTCMWSPNDIAAVALGLLEAREATTRSPGDLTPGDTWAAQAWINLHLIASGDPLDGVRTTLDAFLAQAPAHIAAAARQTLARGQQ